MVFTYLKHLDKNNPSEEEKRQFQASFPPKTLKLLKINNLKKSENLSVENVPNKPASVEISNTHPNHRLHTNKIEIIKNTTAKLIIFITSILYKDKTNRKRPEIDKNISGDNSFMSFKFI